MSRGLSNCNPGNIRQSKVRYKGEVQPSRDPAFKQFESLAWGYRAVFVLLHTYRVRHGLRTVRGMISRWAPPVENHTEAYIRAVAADTGIDPAAPLEGHTLSLVSADGTETALTVETDGESASFALDFTDVAIPAMLIRLLLTA